MRMLNATSLIGPTNVADVVLVRTRPRTLLPTTILLRTTVPRRPSLLIRPTHPSPHPHPLRSTSPDRGLARHLRTTHLTQTFSCGDVGVHTMSDGSRQRTHGPNSNRRAPKRFRRFECGSAELARGTRQVQFKASTVQRIPHSIRLLVDFVKPISTSDYPLRSLFAIRILTTSRLLAKFASPFIQDVLNPLVSNPLPYSHYYSSSPSYSREEFELLQSLLETPPELESEKTRPCLLFYASRKPARSPIPGTDHYHHPHNSGVLVRGH
jgi:hypothetical protein